MVVNYDTPQLTAQLVFSLMRVLERDALVEIVVVENSPSFDPTGILSSLQQAGIVTVLRRRGRRYHGPGLNHGINHLAAEQVGRVDLVWVLDSDVVVLRPDALRLAVAAMSEARAAMAGEVRSPYRLRWPQGVVTTGHDHTSRIWQPHWRVPEPPDLAPDGPHPDWWPYLHVSSLLLDPAVVWQPTLPPFQEDGEPGIAMQAELHRQGLRAADVPFFRDGLLLHLGRGTSFAVRDGKRWRNRYYRWSRNETHHHFEGNPEGPARYAAFWERFREEVPTPRDLVEACRRSERLELS